MKTCVFSSSGEIIMKKNWSFVTFRSSLDRMTTITTVLQVGTTFTLVPLCLLLYALRHVICTVFKNHQKCLIWIFPPKKFVFVLVVNCLNFSAKNYLIAHQYVYYCWMRLFSTFSNTVELLKVIKLKIETSACESKIKNLKLKSKTFIE